MERKSALVGARLVGEALGISADSVRRMARRGDVPFVQITPRLMRFDLRAVLRAIESRAQPTCEAAS
jgi:hypothetical protein